MSHPSANVDDMHDLATTGSAGPARAHTPGSGALSARVPAPVVHTAGRNWVGPKKVVITDLFDPASEYLVRYVVFRTPWIGLQVHKICRPDNDRHLHNHPRPFVALVLRGGYDEERLDRAGAVRVRRVRRGNVMRLAGYHRITRLHRTPTWTLVVVGAKRDTWGFLTEDGFVDADDYTAWLADHDAVTS
ncbi:MAG TPA: hypothetical protein VHD87_15005 [Acidimicrobiales bacterium]|nr:hypothetical protein [Acidimicrobiales bacterium]